MAKNIPVRQTTIQPAKETILGEVETWVKSAFDIGVIVAAGAGGTKLAMIITGVETLEPAVISWLAATSVLYAGARRVWDKERKGR